MAPDTRAQAIAQTTDLSEILRHFQKENPTLQFDQILDMGERQLEKNMKLKQGAYAPPPPQPGIALPPNNNDGLIPNLLWEMIKRAPKLNQRNFHSWLIDFKSSMQCAPEAYSLIFDEQKPVGDWVDRLDQRLIVVLRSACDREGVHNVRFIIDAEQEYNKSARAMFAKLKSELTKNDRRVATQVMDRLANIKMVNNDVHAFIMEIEELAMIGSQVGKEINDDLKVSTLRTHTQYVQSYRTVWNHLRSACQVDDWPAAVAACEAKQFSDESDPYTRGGRNAALLVGEGSSSKRLTDNKGNQIDNQDAYSRGARDPRKPNEEPKCYNCDKPGHIARNCDLPKKDRNARPNAQQPRPPPRGGVAQAQDRAQQVVEGFDALSLDEEEASSSGF